MSGGQDPILPCVKRCPIGLQALASRPNIAVAYARLVPAAPAPDRDGIVDPPRLATAVAALTGISPDREVRANVEDVELLEHATGAFR